MIIATLKQLPKFIGWLVIACASILALSYILDYIHDYRHVDEKTSSQYKIDSLLNDVKIAKSNIDSLKKSFAESEIRNAQRDSILNVGQKTINNEVKKLHAADNKFVLALGDSILRAKGAR